MISSSSVLGMESVISFDICSLEIPPHVIPVQLVIAKSEWFFGFPAHDDREGFRTVLIIRNRNEFAERVVFIAAHAPSLKVTDVVCACI